MLLALQHTAEFFSIVLPGIGLAWAAAFIFRGWLSANWLRFLGGWVSGLILVIALATATTFAMKFVLEQRLAACEAGPAPYECFVIPIPIAYPVVIGLIAFGVFFVGVPAWRIWRSFAGSGQPHAPDTQSPQS